MPSTKAQELIDLKTHEIIGDIAKTTGVSSADVEKVLHHLGLGKALKERLNVTAASVRLAAGQVPQ